MSTPMSPPPPPPRSSGPPKPPVAPPRLIARAEETFNSALARPAGEREAYLAQVCNGDAALDAEVRALLTAHEGAGDFLNTDAPFCRKSRRSWRD